jgi:hypothetical protein
VRYKRREARKEQEEGGWYEKEKGMGDRKLVHVGGFSLDVPCDRKSSGDLPGRLTPGCD